jgi:hypothetical protein
MKNQLQALAKKLSKNQVPKEVITAFEKAHPMPRA